MNGPLLFLVGDKQPANFEMPESIQRPFSRTNEGKLKFYFPLGPKLIGPHALTSVSWGCLNLETASFERGSHGRIYAERKRKKKKGSRLPWRCKSPQKKRALVNPS